MQNSKKFLDRLCPNFAFLILHFELLSRPVHHRFYGPRNRLASQSSAHTGQYSGVRAVIQSFDESCSTALAMKSMQNSKCRIQNVRSFLFPLRLNNDTGQDLDQFFAFLQQGCEATFRNQLSGDQQSQPIAGFSRFLQRDLQLTHEIGTALTGLRFLNIRPNRCPRSDQLPRQRPPCSRLFIQHLAQLYDSHRKLKRPLGNIWRFPHLG